MPQYMMTYLGGNPPSTPEEGQKHFAKYKEWLSSLGGAIISPANPIKDTHTITPDGAITATSTTAMFGYTIIEAETMSAATEMARLSFS